MHWVTAAAAADEEEEEEEEEEDVVGEGMVVAMLGTSEGSVGAAVDDEDEVVVDVVDVGDVEEEGDDVCLSMAHMLFWHV